VVAGFGVLWGMIPLKMLRGTAGELDSGHDDACLGGIWCTLRRVTAPSSSSAGFTSKDGLLQGPNQSRARASRLQVRECQSPSAAGSVLTRPDSPKSRPQPPLSVFSAQYLAQNSRPASTQTATFHITCKVDTPGETQQLAAFARVLSRLPLHAPVIGIETGCSLRLNSKN
jgi:hypothetical protein